MLLGLGGPGRFYQMVENVVADFSQWNKGSGATKEGRIRVGKHKQCGDEDG